MINTMERRVASIALTFGIAAGAVILTGCATPEARISKNPEIYQRLSPRDQALVSQGQIRPGMTMDAGMVGLGCTRSENPGRKAWSPDRNVDVRALRHTFSKLWRALLLRPIRLVVHPAEVPLPVQRGHFL